MPASGRDWLKRLLAPPSNTSVSESVEFRVEMMLFSEINTVKPTPSLLFAFCDQELTFTYDNERLLSDQSQQSSSQRGGA